MDIRAIVEGLWFAVRESPPAGPRDGGAKVTGRHEHGDFDFRSYPKV
jgi:hypothetical protein